MHLNKLLTAKRLKQRYRYHKRRKTFSGFHRCHHGLIFKCNIDWKTLLHKGLSESEIYGDLVYKFKRIFENTDFSEQLKDYHQLHHEHIPI